MKRLWLVLVFFTLIVSYGCKGKEKTEVYSTNEGSLEVKESGGETKEVKITTKEGTTVVKAGKEIPEDIKPYVYPGATAKKGIAWSVQRDKKQSGGLFSTYLNTEDGIDKVVAYYKDKLKDKNPEYYEMTTPNGKMASFTIGEKNRGGITVMLNEKAGEKGTEIHITKVSK